MTCVNTDGNYTCDGCLAGYVGQGQYCQDENECRHSICTAPHTECENLTPGYDCICQIHYDLEITESVGCWPEPHQVLDFINYYTYHICQYENGKDSFYLDCLQTKLDTPKIEQDCNCVYNYSYIDVYGQEQTQTYNWGGDRNFIEHLDTFFDSSFACVGINGINTPWHGNHSGHSYFGQTDNKYHFTSIPHIE